ncbi:MAG: hypothetical protein KAX11_06775, partial [Candidatus Aminicenantes bacterium]|nr:hypothetical protein [Candidatus Aminicenantes bacterium]
LKGREGEGVVHPNEKESLAREIAQKLEDYKDPKTGEHPILKAYTAKEAYQGPLVNQAPDIVIGYNRGYRVSWSSPMGNISKEIIEDNTEKWSGDHMASPEVVPGILLMNQKINNMSPALYDLTPTILKVFNIKTPSSMIGKSII